MGTAGLILDYRTMVGADKFDNLFICRVPDSCANDDQIDPTGLRMKGDTAYLTGSVPKLENIMNFHIGETVTALERTAITLGGQDCIVYSTLCGTIGALDPVQSSVDDIDFLTQLEIAMRNERPSLCGRDHLSFRSSFFPVSHCIDGDLCEQYSLLTPKEQATVAASLDKSSGEVLKKLEDLRNKIL